MCFRFCSYLFSLLILLATNSFAGHPWKIYPHVSAPTTTSAHLSWGRYKAKASVLDIGTEPDDYTFRQYVIKGTENPHVLIEGLEPGKRYYYRLRYHKLEARAWFETNRLSEDHRPFTFTALGDSGSGFPVQDEVATQMRLLRPKFVLHTGDIVYGKGQAEYLKDKYYDPYHSLMNTSPFYLALGNHDYLTRDGFDVLDSVILPTNPVTNNEKFYTFIYGNTQFFALDSTRFIQVGLEGSPQWNWFENELRNSKSLWKVVFFHHPLYSTGKHENETHLMRPLEKLFKRYGVDLVLNGHDHHYERSKIINGVQYIVTGGGGANVRTPHPNYYTAFAIKAHHFVRVDVTDYALTIRAINEKGEVLDHCVLEKGSPVCRTIEPQLFQIVTMRSSRWS